MSLPYIIESELDDIAAEEWAFQCGECIEAGLPKPDFEDFEVAVYGDFCRWLVEQYREVRPSRR